jgi:hypothetical protein
VCLPASRASSFLLLLSSQVGEVVEEDVVEHERYMPLLGWSHKHLLPTDRRRYSRKFDGGNSVSEFPKVECPYGWEWEGPWKVEATGGGGGCGVTLQGAIAYQPCVTQLGRA